MNSKFKSAKVDLVKVDSKDIEIIDSKGSLNSVGREILVDVGKASIPIALEVINKKIELDQETQKLVRDDKRKILNQSAEMLMIQIANEEAKDDYNQERINRWRKELNEIIKELDIMNAKSEGFLKGMLSNITELINYKRK